jgi:hypothetical protein
MNKSKRTTEFFGILFDPQIPLLFMFGALVIAVMGNATYELLLDFIGKTRTNLFYTLGGGALVILFVVVALKARAEILLRRTAARVGGSQAFAVSRTALIFTVGKQSDTIALCLRSQRPQFVAFLCTASSETFADELVKTFELGTTQVFKRITDPWDVTDVREKAGLALSWVQGNSIPQHEIAFDVTGGLTSMSIGAYMIAEEHRIDSQYVRSEYDAKGSRMPNTEEAIFIRRYSEPQGSTQA